MYFLKPRQPVVFMLSGLQFPQPLLSEGMQQQDNNSPSSSPWAPSKGCRQQAKMFSTLAHTSPSQRAFQGQQLPLISSPVPTTCELLLPASSTILFSSTHTHTHTF